MPGRSVCTPGHELGLDYITPMADGQALALTLCLNQLVDQPSSVVEVNLFVVLRCLSGDDIIHSEKSLPCAPRYLELAQKTKEVCNEE